MTPSSASAYRFSGGEKQRIAIARTILRNPPVLVLDEGTVAERGTHDELLEADGRYARLVAGLDVAPAPLDPEFAQRAYTRAPRGASPCASTSRPEVAALRRQLLSAVLVLLAASAVLGSSAHARSQRSAKVRLNEIQVIGTHNSYHRETSEPEQGAYDALMSRPGRYDAFLAYRHATLPRQLKRQDVRGLELDLFGDPGGGLYAEPLVRKWLGLGPLPDPAWRKRGIKVLHMADFDYETTCVRLVTCLRQVRRWSRAHPGHVPMPIMLDLKRSDARALAKGGVVAPAWGSSALRALDREIRSVFDEDEMITPDDVRRRGRTLEQSVLERGWPTLKRTRGQVFFLLYNNPGQIRDAYVAGRRNLQRRVLFTNSRPGFADAAFINRNEPRASNTAEIADLVARGYYVRTRSDVPLRTVLTNNRSMLRAALRSGAQLISTDFPRIGMSARYASDFVATLPAGRPARCNPLNAPRRCRSSRLERG